MQYFLNFRCIGYKNNNITDNLYLDRQYLFEMILLILHVKYSLLI